MAEHHAMKPPMFISSSDLRDLVSMADIVEAMTFAFLQFSQRSSGAVVQPIKTGITVPEHRWVGGVAPSLNWFCTQRHRPGGLDTRTHKEKKLNIAYLRVMPAYCRGADSLGTKLVSSYPNNESKGLPSHLGIVVLFDPSTGQPQALIDGAALTAMRTAGASAAAIKTLIASPPSVLCVVGCGVQARSHVEAFRTIYKFSEIRIWGRAHSKAVECAQDVGGDEVKVVDSLEEAVKNADIIVTVTSSREPLVFGKWLKPGTVVCSVGACRPDERELDDELVQNSIVIADSKDAALKESGDIMQSKTELFAEIGEIISGTKTLPKLPQCGKKFIMFKSLGMAVEDVVASKLIYDRYVEKHGQAKQGL